MLPFITARRDTNPIRLVLNANKSSQIVSTCRPLAAADLGAATYRGNNPPRIPGGLASVLQSTREPGTDEQEGRSVSELSQEGRGSTSHGGSLPGCYASRRGRSEDGKEEKIAAESAL